MTKTKRTHSLKSITAYDVARLAKVTQATVSRTINKPETVAPATRQRVYDAMRALNYRPSASAQGLARGKSGVIGLLTCLDVTNARLFGLVLEGISSVLPEEKHLLNISYVPNVIDVSVEEILQSPLLSKQCCDGIIIYLPNFSGDTTEIYRQMSCPYVNINPAGPQPTNCVIPDDHAVAEMAVEHLISRGHRRIAYLRTTSFLSHAYSRTRYEGYIMSMSRAGLQIVERSDDPMVVSRTDQLSHRLAMVEERLMFWLNMDDPITAIVAQDSSIANQIAEMAYHREWRIPKTFSLISCDDLHIGFSSSLPISAVDLNMMTIGAEATRMMLKRLAAPDVPIPSVFVPGKLRERKTVADITN